jgi:hypothetical protein
LIAGSRHSTGIRGRFATITFIPARYSSCGYSWMVSTTTKTQGLGQVKGFSPRVPAPRVATSRM